MTTNRELDRLAAAIYGKKELNVGKPRYRAGRWCPDEPVSVAASPERLNSASMPDKSLSKAADLPKVCIQ